MSGINGDKSRFNRFRKKKIARRARNMKQFKDVAAQPKSEARPPEQSRKETSL